MSWVRNATGGLTGGMQGNNMDGMKRRQDSGHSPDIRVAKGGGVARPGGLSAHRPLSQWRRCRTRTPYPPYYLYPQRFLLRPAVHFCTSEAPATPPQTHIQMSGRSVQSEGGKDEGGCAQLMHSPALRIDALGTSSSPSQSPTNKGRPLCGGRSGLSAPPL
jgi:hypothetical protein